MPLQNENRECLVCDQVISSDDPAVPVKLHPFPRVVHPTCARLVVKALEEWEDVQKEELGDEEVLDDDIDDISDEDVE